MSAVIRRLVLAVLLLATGLALIESALVHQLPGVWVPPALTMVDRYVGAEGAAVGAVLGVGLLVAAIDPVRFRIMVVLAILSGILSVALLVERYYAGQSGIVPPIVFWVAATTLLLAFFPIRRRPRDDSPTHRSLAQRPMPVVPQDPPRRGRSN